MVREGQSWNLGEPDLNDKGQPIIHNIATKLGCIRPNADIDLPPHSVFPEDEAGLAQLAAELHAQQPDQEFSPCEATMENSSTVDSRSDRASPSELDHSDFEHDYKPSHLLGGDRNNTNLQTMSPESFCSGTDFDVNTPISGFDSHSAAMFGSLPRSTFPPPLPLPMWGIDDSSSGSMSQYMPGLGLNMADMMLSQGLIESEFGTIKPHMVSCADSEAMLGLGDPMIYSGYNMEAAMRS